MHCMWPDGSRVCLRSVISTRSLCFCLVTKKEKIWSLQPKNTKCWVSCVGGKDLNCKEAGIINKKWQWHWQGMSWMLETFGFVITSPLQFKSFLLHSLWLSATFSALRPINVHFWSATLGCLHSFGSQGVTFHTLQQLEARPARKLLICSNYQ